MNTHEIYIKKQNQKGTSISHHFVWNKDLFLKSQIQQAKIDDEKENTKTSVSISSFKEFKGSK